MEGQDGVRNLRVMVYVGQGVGGDGPQCLRTTLQTRASTVQFVTHLKYASLDDVDVLVFPGGSSSMQLAGLGPEQAMRVRTWVQRGGGFVGFCAGAFLGCKGALGLLDVDYVRNMTKMGELRGSVLVDGAVEMNYHNGPLWDFKSGRSGIEVVARVTDVVSGELSHVRSKMRNKPCIISGECGRGRVVLCGPHPEHTPGLEDYTWQLIQRAAPPQIEPREPRAFTAADAPAEAARGV